MTLCLALWKCTFGRATERSSHYEVCPDQVDTSPWNCLGVQVAKLQLEVKCLFPTEWWILSSLKMTFIFFPQIITCKIYSIQMAFLQIYLKLDNWELYFMYHLDDNQLLQNSETDLNISEGLRRRLGTEDLIHLKLSDNNCWHNMFLLSLWPSSSNINLNDSWKELWLLM